MPIMRPREVLTQASNLIPNNPTIPLDTTRPSTQPTVLDNNAIEQLNESLTNLSFHLAQGVGPRGTIPRPPPKWLIWP